MSKGKKKVFLPQKQKQRSDNYVIYVTKEKKKLWLGLAEKDKGVIGVDFTCAKDGVNCLVTIDGLDLHPNIAAALKLKDERMAIMMRGLCWMISTLRTGDPKIDRENAMLENAEYERQIIAVKGMFQ